MIKSLMIYAANKQKTTATPKRTVLRIHEQMDLKIEKKKTFFLIKQLVKFFDEKIYFLLKI